MAILRKTRIQSKRDSRHDKPRLIGLLRLVTQVRNILTDRQHVTLNRLADDLGDRFRIRLGFGNAVFLSDPVSVGHVLSLDESSMTTGIARQRLAGMFPEHCLLYADGEKHIRMRRAIAKAFSESVRAFDTPNQFEKLVSKVRHSNRPDLSDLIYDCLVDVTSNLIFGVAPKEICHAANQAMRQFSQIPTAVVLFPRLQHMPLYRRGFIEYRQAQQDFERQVAKCLDYSPDCFFAAMKRQQFAGNLLSQEVCDNATFFFLVMIRTMSTLFSNVARALAVENRWQERLRVEEDLRGEMAASRLRRAVVKETIRLFPFAPIYVRRAVIDQEIDGFKIRKGEYIVLSPDLIHHRTASFPNPQCFSPERFFEHQHHGSFVPFGGGTRHCIGSGWILDSMSELLKVLLPIVEFQTHGDHFGPHDFSMHTIFRTPRRRGFSSVIRTDLSGLGESNNFADICEAT